ncbi:hypothetical protein KJ766_02900 [Patescibacteria group bacterium]|nr:hypothetical protein [Patescibacteria group bacterium]
MKPYLIGIAGPSGAGKSLFCRLMLSNFNGVSRLKFDDFFKDTDDVEKINGVQMWDYPTSIKWEPLLEATKRLKSGEYAIVPNYSRKEDRMIGEKCVFTAPIILVDGFQSLYSKEMRDLLDLQIFFDLSEDSQIKRRVLRQPWVDKQYLSDVMIPCARKYVIPTKQFADYIVNAEQSPQAVADQCTSIIQTRLGDRLKKLGNRNIFQTVSIKAKV